MKRFFAWWVVATSLAALIGVVIGLAGYLLAEERIQVFSRDFYDFRLSATEDDMRKFLYEVTGKRVPDKEQLQDYRLLRPTTTAGDWVKENSGKSMYDFLMLIEEIDSTIEDALDNKSTCWKSFLLNTNGCLQDRAQFIGLLSGILAFLAFLAYPIFRVVVWSFIIVSSKKEEKPET